MKWRMSRNYKDHERREMQNVSGHGHGNGNQNINNVVDFRNFILEPRNVDNSETLLPEDVYFAAATIVFPELRDGDLVWLNGVVGLENESGNAGADVKVSIFKGVGAPPALINGQEIYRSDFDIATTDDEAVAPDSFI